jgi:hypothetical protein
MGYGARKIYNKFRQPNWTYSGVQKTVEKIKKTGTIDRIEGSGRPRSSMTDGNIRKIVGLAVSPPNRHGTHLSIRQIARKTKLHRSSVHRIIKQSGTSTITSFFCCKYFIVSTCHFCNFRFEGVQTGKSET